MGENMSKTSHVELKEKFASFRRSWKLQAKNVCFGTKNNQFGRFHLKNDGRIVAMKLVHQSGSVTCNPENKETRWGCGNRYGKHELLLYVTDGLNRIIFPKVTAEKSSYYWYTILGYHMDSNPLVF